MSVSLLLRLSATATETLATNATLGSDQTVKFDGLDLASTTLNGASTPPVTKVGCTPKALSSGTGTIDLTALVGANGVAVDGSGLRVQVMALYNPSANSITVAKGASNGYDGFGSAFSLTVPAGGRVLIYNNDTGTDISGTNKNLDLTGTAAQVLDYEIVMG